MVGLSVILENYKDLSENRRNCGGAAAATTTAHQVISKGSMIKPPSPTLPSSPSGVFARNKTAPSYVSSCGFLEHCFLCKQKLLPGKDIYMYNGDKAFCSVECRCRQIFMDEEELTAAKNGCTREYNCSSTVPSSSRSGNKGPTNNRAITNAFAY